MNNELLLSKEIYDVNHIKKAISEYNHLAQITIKTDANSIRLVFSNTKYDVAETTKEFENYLIQLLASNKNYDNM